MSQQRAVKKKLMKWLKKDFKKVEHFFTRGKKVGMRVTSMIGLYKFKQAPGAGVRHET